MSQSQQISRTALISAVAISVAGTSALIFGGQALRRVSRTRRLKRSVGREVDRLEEMDVSPPTLSRMDSEVFSGVREGREKQWGEGEYDEQLIREQLSRNYTFLGEEAMQKVRDSYVVVVGCGGVGSWCALMLLRSGVGRLLLIDFDLTTLSSLNRHAAATLEDVGTPKVEATRKYLKKIAPWARIDVQVGLWRKGVEGEKWLEGADWVVDAIDNINTKVDLLEYCHKKELKVFSSMGAGAKQDPTRVQIADISNTLEDPLARTVRQRLRLKGVTTGIPVVYSTEVPGAVKLLPLPDEEFEKGKVHELGAFDDFRVRILPVLGPLPSIFGLHIASYILLDIAGKPLEHPLPVKNRWKLYDRVERGLMTRENRVGGTADASQRIPIGADDVAYVFEDLFQGRSAIPPFPILSRPNAVRWQRDEPLTMYNCVIMSQDQADKHEKECLVSGKSVEEVWGEETVAAIGKRLHEARKVAEWRQM